MLLASLIAVSLLASDGESVVNEVDAAVADERRRRLMAGTFQIATGGVRMVAGATLLGTAPNGRGGRAGAGRVHLIAGGLSVGLGTFSLAYRRPMEQLQRGRSFQALRVMPSSKASLVAVDREWIEAARRARRLRLIGGSASLLAGSTLSVMATVRIWGLGDGWNLLNSTVLLTGLMYLGRGVAGVVVKSPAERSLLNHRSSRNWAITPTLGGLSVSGRF